MNSLSIFSNREDLRAVVDRLYTYLRLSFAGYSIPGNMAEFVLAEVRGGESLCTYDFVDVISSGRNVGWQVKSTRSTTPVTWKRAKLENQQELMRRSETPTGVQDLGDRILEFCNAHAIESLEKYDLEEIGYARLVAHQDRTITYFERRLISRVQPTLFEPRDFTWKWSKSKTRRPGAKEQLSALHGFSDSGDKWFAWHGRGENQLHFCGESTWWPSSGDRHSLTFRLPEPRERVSLDTLSKLLVRLDAEGGPD